MFIWVLLEHKCVYCLVNEKLLLTFQMVGAAESLETTDHILLVTDFIHSQSCIVSVGYRTIHIYGNFLAL